MASNKKPYRKLTKSGSGVYYLTLPADLVKQLGWRERQKLIIEKTGQTLKIKDWKKK